MRGQLASANGIWMSPVQEASPGECKEDDGKKKGLADKIERRKVGVLCVYARWKRNKAKEKEAIRCFVEEQMSWGGMELSKELNDNVISVNMRGSQEIGAMQVVEKRWSMWQINVHCFLL